MTPKVSCGILYVRFTNFLLQYNIIFLLIDTEQPFFKFLLRRSRGSGFMFMKVRTLRTLLPDICLFWSSKKLNESVRTKPQGDSKKLNEFSKHDDHKEESYGLSCGVGKQFHRPEWFWLISQRCKSFLPIWMIFWLNHSLVLVT